MRHSTIWCPGFLWIGEGVWCYYGHRGYRGDVHVPVLVADGHETVSPKADIAKNRIFIAWPQDQLAHQNVDAVHHPPGRSRDPDSDLTVAHVLRRPGPLILVCTQYPIFVSRSQNSIAGLHSMLM